MSTAEPYRVCHLGKYYPPAPGGMETHVQTLAHAQAALGAEVRVVCVDHEGASEKEDRPSRREAARARSAAARANGFKCGVAAEDDGPVRVTRTARRRSFARLDLCPDLPDVLRGLERDGVQVLHLHTPNPTMLLAMAIVRPRLPLVITHHSDIIKQRVLKYAMRPFERFVYGKAARVQATSEIYRAGSKFLERYAGRTDVLPLGLDLNPFACPSNAARVYAEKLRKLHAGPLWLAVGRLVYYKGLHVAVEALRHVPGTLLIVGSGPLEAELRQLAYRLGVADRVAWRGYLTRDELAGAYHAAAALWFPSNARSEAFGLVQVEAMAGGCPVINATIAGSGVPWVSRHEESGLTVPVGQPIALANAARRLLHEPGLRDRLSAGARRRAAEHFDHLTMARLSLETYCRVLSGDAVAATAFVPARAAIPVTGRPAAGLLSSRVLSPDPFAARFSDRPAPGRDGAAGKALALADPDAGGRDLGAAACEREPAGRPEGDHARALKAAPPVVRPHLTLLNH